MTRKNKFAIAAALVVALAALAVWRIEAVSTRILTTQYKQPGDALHVPISADVQTGAQIAKLGGCASCHGDDLTGSIAYRGTFGTVLVAPNLTTLSKRLDAQQLATIIRYGIKPDGTAIIGMPSAAFMRLSDSDMAALILYLRSLPEKPGVTAKTKWGFGGRTWLTIGLTPVAPKLVKPQNRGPVMTPSQPRALAHYLTQTYCSACHGPNLQGGREFHSPDLREAITHYSPAQFTHFFTTGEAIKGHDTGPMTHQIKTRFRHFTPAEISAIYAYLTTPAPADKDAK